ncbi:MAG: hypothetical protein QM534_07365 [Sediminibacterium sp.]|nr:hypothetical protein [Sediminibacterium sp.]
MSIHATNSFTSVIRQTFISDTKIYCYNSDTSYVIYGIKGKDAQNWHFKIVRFETDSQIVLEPKNSAAIQTFVFDEVILSFRRASDNEYVVDFKYKVKESLLTVSALKENPDRVKFLSKAFKTPDDIPEFTIWNAMSQTTKLKGVAKNKKIYLNKNGLGSYLTLTSRNTVKVNQILIQAIERGLKHLSKDTIKLYFEDWKLVLNMSKKELKELFDNITKGEVLESENIQQLRVENGIIKNEVIPKLYISAEGYLSFFSEDQRSFLSKYYISDINRITNDKIYYKSEHSKKEQVQYAVFKKIDSTKLEVYYKERDVYPDTINPFIMSRWKKPQCRDTLWHFREFPFLIADSMAFTIVNSVTDNVVGELTRNGTVFLLNHTNERRLEMVQLLAVKRKLQDYILGVLESNKNQKVSSQYVINLDFYAYTFRACLTNEQSGQLMKLMLNYLRNSN